jgi:hypothetical protein
MLVMALLSRHWPGCDVANDGVLSSLSHAGDSIVEATLVVALPMTMLM